jgi:hypothetical protein
LEIAGRRGNSVDSRTLVVELKEVEEEGEAAVKAFVGFGLLGKVQCVVRDWGTKSIPGNRVLLRLWWRIPSAV